MLVLLRSAVCNAGMLALQAAPRTGLTRPRGSGRGGAAGGPGRSGFVPPFVGKAIEHHTGGGAAGGGGAAAGGGEEGPLSARTLEMLGSECQPGAPAVRPACWECSACMPLKFWQALGNMLCKVLAVKVLL